MIQCLPDFLEKFIYGHDIVRQVRAPDISDCHVPVYEDETPVCKTHDLRGLRLPDDESEPFADFLVLIGQMLIASTSMLDPCTVALDSIEIHMHQ